MSATDGRRLFAANGDSHAIVDVPDSHLISQSVSATTQSEMTAQSSNSSGPAWVDGGTEYGSTTFGMAGHADGEALRLQQYLTPDSQKPIIVRFEHTMSDTETLGTVTYRVTSRFSSTPWNLHVDLWDWTAGGGSGAWVEIMDNPLTLYMKTRDAFGVDEKYLYHDTGNGVYRMRSRLRVETTSSIITNPTRNLEIEQALFINGPSS